MTGLELVAGYLVAWGVIKLKRTGRRLDEETGEVIDAGLDQLHDAIACKLGTDPALVKLDVEVSLRLERPDPAAVRDAVEEAAEGDPDFVAVLEELLARPDEVLNGAPSVAGLDARGASGAQAGSSKTQTNTFG